MCAIAYEKLICTRVTLHYEKIQRYKFERSLALNINAYQLP